MTGAIGKSLKRLEDPRLLRGEGRFVDDLQPPGCLHVAMVRSPFSSGRLAGVEATFTAADLEGSCRPLEVHLTTPAVVSPARPILAVGRVRFAGEMIGAVVARTRYEAADAAQSASFEIDALPAVITFEDALADSAPLLHDAVSGNLYFTGHRSYGGVAAAFTQADMVVKGEVTHPRVAPEPIEPRGVLAMPNDAGGATVWTSTQVPHLVADAIAECLDLDRRTVRVVAADVGGAFGGKAQVYPEEILLAWIARRVQAPVKWIESRSEHMQAASHARDQRVRFEAAVRKDGRVLGLKATIHSSIGAYGIRPFGPLLDPLGTAGLMTGPYDIRDYEYTTYAVATNKSPEGPYRGVGMVTAVLAHERLMDLIAARLGIDPLEVRRLNFVPRDRMPYRTVTGHPYESGDYAAALDAAARLFGYDEMKNKGAAGIGVACYVEYTGAGSATFKGRGMLDIPGVDTARVWMADDGRLRVQTSSPAIGQGTHTTLAQVAAEAFGTEPENVDVMQTDTETVGSGTGTFMSRGSVGAATSVFRAASLLRELAEESSEESGELDVTVTYDAAQASHPYATHMCAVEVDRETGAVQVVRYVVAEDCGPLINPKIVDGQVEGGIAQAVGAALLEEVVYGPDGELRTGTFLDYMVPSVGEVPDVVIEHQETPSTVHELGTKGVGEGGTIGGTAAIAGAVADAMSLAEVRLPLTPDRLVSG